MFQFFLKISILAVLLISCSIFSNEPAKKLRTVPKTYQFPSVGPEGKYIVFYREKIVNYDWEKYGEYTVDLDPDSTGLYVMNADGSNMNMLQQGFTYNYPEISPDGKWLVYGKSAHIYKVPFKGDTIAPEKTVQLTQRGRNFFPRWSPKGEWIVYRNTNCGTGPPQEPPEGQCGVMVMRKDGSEKLDPDPPCSHADWSDSNNIFVCVGPKRVLGYSIRHDSTYVIANIPAEHSGFDLRYTAFSPTGTNILSQNTSSYPNFDFGIYITDIDKGEIMKWNGIHTGMPGWFPDGKHIVYRDTKTSTIWMADINGNNRMQLTKNYGLEYEYYEE